MSKSKPDSVFLTQADVDRAAMELVRKIELPVRSLYPVPRGGFPVAYILREITGCTIAKTPEEADLIVDDIYASGATRQKYPTKRFAALFGQPGAEQFATIGEEVSQNQWLVFPWEQSEEASAEDIFVRLLQFIGEDPTREGLQETPKRMAKAWRFWTKGYREDPKAMLKVFEDGAEGCDEMIVVRSIPFFSFCEHHLAMIIGTADVGYIPNGKIVGLSKIARLVDIFARRLQVQERLTNQIADTLIDCLAPLGVAVVIRARHMCMESRGVEKTGSETITSAMRGAFRDEPATRSEFMRIIGNK